MDHGLDLHHLLAPTGAVASSLAIDAAHSTLSYAGYLTVTVRADTHQFPDLDVLTAAMERDWRALAGSAGFGVARDH
jgi:hypothetical protein